MWWHSDAREGKLRGNWRMEWVASTIHTTSEHGVSSIITADSHTSATSSRLSWTPPSGGDLNGLVRFARKTKSGFCACASIFQLASTSSGPCLYLLRAWQWIRGKKGKLIGQKVSTSEQECLSPLRLINSSISFRHNITNTEKRIRLIR